MRFILPIILIAISISVFFVFANPIYVEIGNLRAEVASYDEALNNSKKLEDARDVLTAKKNNMNPADLARLEQFLPSSIDNIRLILEIEKMASPYGMTLKNVKYNATETKDSKDGKNPGASPVGSIQGGGAVQNLSDKDYGVWDLEFSTTGTYNNFLNFMKNLEKNLRMVDIASIQFSSSDVTPQTKTLPGATPNNLSAESYTYNFKIKTYWLRN